MATRNGKEKPRESGKIEVSTGGAVLF
jgi:hypothetical protein